MTFKVPMTHVYTHLEGQKGNNAWSCCCVSAPQKGAEELKTTLCAKGSQQWSSLRKFPVDSKLPITRCRERKPRDFLFRLGNVWNKQLNKSQLVTDALGVLFLTRRHRQNSSEVRRKKKKICVAVGWNGFVTKRSMHVWTVWVFP